MQYSARNTHPTTTTIRRLCGNLNPDIRIFFILSAARVVAVLGFALRTFSGFHRDELYDTRILGIRTLSLASALATAYTAWLVWSLLPPLRRLHSSGETVCDIIFKEQDVQPLGWLLLSIGGDIVFFSAFFLTTLKIESDLYIFYMLPIITANTYLRRPAFKQLATAATCVALVAAVFAVYYISGGQFDSRPNDFATHGMRRLLTNVLLIRVVALLGAAFVSSQFITTFRDSRALLSSVLDTIPIVIWRKRRDGVFTFVNRNLTTLIKRPYHEILGRTDAELFGSAARRFREGDNEALTAGSFTDPMEPLPLPSGKKQFNFVYKVPIPGCNGITTGTQGLLIDMSWVYKSTIQDLEVLSALASHASMLNHQIANKLDTISLCARLARETCANFQHPGCRSRDLVMAQCAAIQEITDGLTTRLDDLARLRKGTLKEERLDVVQLAEDALRRLSAKTHPFEVGLDHCPKPVVILGDRIHIEDAIDNLIINAKEGIQRYLERHPSAAIVFRVSVAMDNSRARALLIVINTGEISEADLRQLQSGRSITLKSDAAAHGKGLPAVRQCASFHNAKFTISRSPEHRDCIVTCIDFPTVP